MQTKSYAILKNIVANGIYSINIETGIIRSYGRCIEFLPKEIGKMDKKTGYKRVHLRWAKKEHVFYVQDVVAVKAGWNIENKKIIHKDGNKLNNSIDNLELI